MSSLNDRLSLYALSLRSVRARYLIATLEAGTLFAIFLSKFFGSSMSRFPIDFIRSWIRTTLFFPATLLGNDRLGFLEFLNYVLDFRNSGSLPAFVFCSIGSLNFDELFELDIFFVQKKPFFEVVQHFVFIF